MSDLDRHDTIRAVHWRGDRLSLLDQRLLPFEETFVDCRSAAEVAQAIPGSGRARRAGHRHRGSPGA